MEAADAAPLGTRPGRQRWGWLPRGRTLPEENWRARHRVILITLWLHVPALIAFARFGGLDPWITHATFEGNSWTHSVLEGGAIAIFALAASIKALPRRIRAIAASLGFVSASAVLTHLSGGFIEAHFHFFVVIGVIAMYQDWFPFLVAVAYVAIHHGTAGTLDPSSVYNHPAAIDHPWNWAFIHASFILALSAAQIAHWRMEENARERTDAVLLAAGEPIIGVDDDGAVSFANLAATRLLGESEKALVGIPFSSAVHLGGSPLEALEDGRPRSAEDDVLSVQGNTVPVAWTSTPMSTGHGGAVITLRDLTMQKRDTAHKVRQERASAELEHLRRQDAFKTRFMNTAAHELNTPLTPVNIQLRLLRRKALPGMDKKQQESFEILDRNIGRFARLIQDLLDSTRLQAGKLGMTVSNIDLEALVKEATEGFRGIQGPRVEAVTDGPLRIMGDRDRLMQVVQNLINNAVKFTPDHGSVTVSARQSGLAAVVTVEDTGIGMTGEQIERLFLPFSQVHDMEGVTRQGSGLGLYISKAFIDLHRGRIRCSSEGVGKGTKVTIELPLAPEDDPPGPGDVQPGVPN